MILAPFVIAIFAIACPHTRGDDPERYAEDFVSATLSPYAWG